MNQLIEELKSGLDNSNLAFTEYAGELTITAPAGQVYEVLKKLKERFGFEYLSDITASDLFTDQDRFEVAYNIVSFGSSKRIRVKTRVDESNPELESTVPLWNAANWFEREAFDMMGVKFKNHPDMRRMYLPEDFEYYPLRKEFPLIGIMGTLEIPEKDPPKGYA